MKKLILMVVLLAFVKVCKCQEEEYHKYEFSFWGSGGLSSILYKPTIGEHDLGYGGAAGLGYTYFFHPRWGIGTGLEIAEYRAKMTFGNLFDSYATIDDENDPFTLLADIDNFEETQKIYYLNIPLMLQYQGKGTNKFCFALGGKLGIPVGSNYQSTGDYLTRGKYVFTRDIFENMPEHGFGPYPNLTRSGKLKMNLNYQLLIEAGYKWHLNNDWKLFTGIYCNYGMNDLRKNKNSTEHIFQYNASNPVEYTVNSITQSRYTTNQATVNYIDKMNTVSLGIKVSILFQSGKKE